MDGQPLPHQPSFFVDVNERAGGERRDDVGARCPLALISRRRAACCG
jgi:hypothetical protein